MTQPTSSPYAKDTPKMADEQDTSGTRPTARDFENISSASTLTPEQRDAMVTDMLQRRYGRKVKTMSDWHFKLWDGWANLKCRWLGLHTMLPLEEWDSVKGTIQFRGHRCWVCDTE